MEQEKERERPPLSHWGVMHSKQIPENCHFGRHVFTRGRYRCYYCGCVAGEAYIDHSRRNHLPSLHEAQLAHDELVKRMVAGLAVGQMRRFGHFEALERAKSEAIE